jgi:N-6 DNA Methylase
MTAPALDLAEALGGPEAALSLLALRLAEPAGFLQRHTCAGLAGLAPGPLSRDLAAVAGALRRRTGGTLPPWPLKLPATILAARAAVRVLAEEPPAPEALCSAAEALGSAAVGHAGRRAAGLYYTPPGLADEVVALSLAHGAVGRSGSLRVIDPCAGAGAFLAAAARALAERGPARGAAAAGAARRDAALACSGADLDPFALRVARAALALCAGPLASARDLSALRLSRLDSLRRAPGPKADLLVSNPPYGHLADVDERAFLSRTLPALRGGEIDRYAAFLLRSLQLVREGGTAGLLIPDTWMTNARAGALRAAVLAGAEVAAIVDLGKPFAAAKDTRVQALVLVRRSGGHRRATFAARLQRDGLVALAKVPRAELNAAAKSGWQPYRSRGERALCAAMDRASVPLGQVCQVGYGLRTGDNARHVERRAHAERSAGAVALCGGEDVVPFALRLIPKHLMDAVGPLSALAGRQLGRPRVAVQRIRTNSTAPWARWLEAAPVPEALVCLDSLSTLACDDGDRLWALLALVHSVALNRYHRLRTTDVNVKPSLLRDLPVPRALLTPEAASALADLARRRSAQAAAEPAQRRRARSDPALAPALERRIDRAVYALYALDEERVLEAERGFWGNRFPVENPRLSEAGLDPMSDPPRTVVGLGRLPR